MCDFTPAFFSSSSSSRTVAAGHQRCTRLNIPARSDTKTQTGEFRWRKRPCLKASPTGTLKAIREALRLGWPAHGRQQISLRAVVLHDEGRAMRTRTSVMLLAAGALVAASIRQGLSLIRSSRRTARAGRLWRSAHASAGSTAGPETAAPRMTTSSRRQSGRRITGWSNAPRPSATDTSLARGQNRR